MRVGKRGRGLQKIRPVVWALVALGCGGEVRTESESQGRDGGRSDAQVTPTKPIPVDPDPSVKPPPDTFCGDGMVQSGELCDGTNLRGETCATVTMGSRLGGNLRCGPGCTFDTTGCQIGDGGAGGGGYGGMFGGAGGGQATGGATSRGGTAGNGGSAGATYGDPHVFTADGFEYDFQAVGEFILLEDRDDPSFVVQVRQEPFGPFKTLSSNTAIGALVAGDRISIYAGSPAEVHVEGLVRTVEGSLALPHGGHIERHGALLRIVWPTGEALAVSASFSELLNVSYHPADGRRSRRLHGLIGTPDGNPRNDLTTRTGEVLRKPDGDRLYDVFGRSFRIAAAESLFDYAVGQDTRSFTDEAFPYGSRAAATLPPERLKVAYLTCVLEGVTDAAALEACTRDVALTGDRRFARAAATLSNSLCTGGDPR